MSKSGYVPPDGYITVGEAAKVLGVSRMTARARFQREKVKTFRDSSDPRFRLVRRADIEALAVRRVIEEDAEGQNKAAA